MSVPGRAWRNDAACMPDNGAHKLVFVEDGRPQGHTSCPRLLRLRQSWLTRRNRVVLPFIPEILFLRQRRYPCEPPQSLCLNKNVARGGATMLSPSEAWGSRLPWNAPLTCSA